MNRKYSIIKKLRKFRKIALILAANMLLNTIFPTVSLALTNGPSSPEFSSFEPVATTNMVDPFTGSFTYNLPVLSVPGSDGGGYSLSLSYHSGATPEEEASWVGLGWTLNAGAINRHKNGIPDDFKGVDVKRYNQTTPVWTVSTTGDLALEAVSQDQPKKPDKFSASFGAPPLSYAEGEGGTSGALSYVQPKASASVRYNNYQGFTRTNGYSASFKGMASLSMRRSGGESTFGISVNPMAILANVYKKQFKKAKEESKKAKDEFKESGKSEDAWRHAYYEVIAKGNAAKKLAKTNTAMKFFNPSIAPSNVNTFPGFSVARTVARSNNFSGSLEINAFGVGIQLGYSGNKNYSIPIPENDMKAYGYMHNPNWEDYFDDNNGIMHQAFDDGTTIEKNKDSKIIADYAIEKESSFNKHDKFIGIPFNSADQYMVTGEGAMGGFRFHHEKIGHFYPTPTTNKQFIMQGGIEFGIAQPIQVGLDVGAGFQRTQIGNWSDGKRGSLWQHNFDGSVFPKYNNDKGGTLRYTEKDELYSTYFEKVGKDLQVVEDQSNGQNGLPDPEVFHPQVGKSSPIYYSTYHNGEIYAYANGSPSDENDLSVNNLGKFDKLASTEEHRDTKPEDGIAEIMTINPGGNRYVYGIPVYAKNQVNYTVRHTENNSPVRDDPTSNIPATVEMPLFYDNPKDNYSITGDLIEEPYATTYLLTQITTPNYVDVNDNGPDEEDFGGWTKFMYRKKYGRESDGTGGYTDDWYNHRAPYTGLYYSKGKINDHYDQTGSMSRGEKEVYYTKAIETKTHVAFFITNSTTEADFVDMVDELTNGDTQLKNKLNAYLNGSGEVRYDSWDAANISGGMDPAAEGEMGDRSLDRLEKIVLFSKSRLQKPVSTNHFRYSYKLCKGVPNHYANVPGSGIGDDESGKLTLDKVWTESEGIARSKVAPYQFEYNYFKNYDQSIKDQYPEITDGFFDPDGNGVCDWNEDPRYDVDLLDPWGNYMDKSIAQDQRNKIRSWMSQRKSPDTYDPAAWNLKRIILPSGGEIHVQYEQKDYEYVQDKDVMAMVSLDPVSSHDNEMKYDENRYAINLQDLEMSSAQEAEDYFKKLVRYYFDGSSGDFDVALEDNKVSLTDAGITPSVENSKIYFRFLYSYWNNLPSLFFQGAEGKFISSFIDGYAPVNEIEWNGANKIYIQFGGKKKNKYNVPKRLCRENLLTQGGTALDREGQLWTDFSIVNDEIHRKAFFNPDGYDIEEDGNNTDEKEILKAVKKKINSLGVAGDIFEEGVLLFGVKNPKLWSNKVCAEFDPELSAVKLPMFKAKKGGGIRVKRLLTYNPGIETGEESLYGTEYIYKMSDGSSSGVATYEPNEMRVENPLVGILPRRKQTLYNKLLSGRDKKYQEGPLGEQLYPSPSVSHRRVVMKNIYQGKSAPGFTVNNYLTCKTFPTVSVENTKIHDPDSKRNNKQTEHYKKAKINLPLGLFNYRLDNAWITQGYLFKVDDRHGKMKSTKTYSGVVSSEYPAVTSMHHLLSSKEYEYSNPFHPLGDYQTVISMEDNGTDEYFVADTKYYPGEEEDMTMYMGKVEDRTMDFSLELDMNIWISTPPVLQIGFGATVNMAETQLAQHVTNRVIRRNSFLKKEVSYADGMTSTTEYLAYDKYTGNPVVTKSIDQYEGTSDQLKHPEDQILQGKDHEYYSFNIPASWVYSGLGQKTLDFNNFNILSSNAGNVVTYMENPLAKFVDDQSSSDPTRYKKWDPYNQPIERVVEASATVMEKNRFSTGTDLEGGQIDINKVLQRYGVVSNTATQDKLNKFYYPIASFIYTSEIKSANTSDNTYEAGILENFTFFDWDPQSGTVRDYNYNNNWKYSSFVTKFSPYAKPLEEKDVLGIPSAARFAYGKILPSIVAANAEYESIAFEDFELTDDYITSDVTAHTGKRSLKLNNLQPDLIFQDLKLTNQLLNKGGHFKVWLKSVSISGQVNPNPPAINIGGNSHSLQKVARVGEWTLYQTYINNWGNITAGTPFNIVLEYAELGDETAYIDDPCFNPKEAAVQCFVYDPASFRLKAQFADQHFATKYEYNAEGKLTRTIIETERGEKTLKEQQYNVHRDVDRNDD